MSEITVPVVTDDDLKTEILDAYELAVKKIEELEAEIAVGHEEFAALSSLFNEYQRQSNLGNLAADYIRAHRKIETVADADKARAIWEQIEALAK